MRVHAPLRRKELRIKMIKHLDLFSGIGGFALAGKMAYGAKWHTAVFCEIDKFCQKVLSKNFPNVPIFNDITKVNGYDIIRQFGAIGIVTGGFPCQPFSVAGQRKGTDDDRALWPEMLRIIAEVNPAYILAENVAGIVSMELDNVLSDMENLGYSCQTFIIPACALNAPHKRDRVWFVAQNSKLLRRSIGEPDKQGQIGNIGNTCTGTNVRICNAADAPNTKSNELQRGGDTRQRRFGFADNYKNAPDTHSQRQLQPQGAVGNVGGRAPDGNYGFTDGRHWYEVAARTCGVDDGLPRRMDRGRRLKALGNAIVPQVAAEILKAMGIN